MFYSHFKKGKKEAPQPKPEKSIWKQLRGLRKFRIGIEFKEKASCEILD